MKRKRRNNTKMSAEIDRVRSIILDNFKSTVPEIREPVETLVTGRAKMLRPTFLLMSASFGQFDRDRIENIAAAIEMFHIATLVHDDIIDDAGTRRGSPSVHATAGRKNAVLIGDYLFARSFSLVSQYASVENQRRIARVVSVICESEISETAARFVPTRSVRRYLRQITGKTAALFSLACHTGAQEANCSTGVQNTLRRAGYNVGMAFQIIDDILDYTGTDESLGKPSGTDLKEGVFTLPVIQALNKDTGELFDTLSRPPYTNETIRSIIDMADSLGGIAAARASARQYTQRALSEISSLPETSTSRELYALTRQLLVRHY